MVVVLCASEFQSHFPGTKRAFVTVCADGDGNESFAINIMSVIQN